MNSDTLLLCSMHNIKEVFDLVTNVSFYNRVIDVRPIYCPIGMYNKYKPGKFCVDFFIMIYSKYYFIYHLDAHKKIIEKMCMHIQRQGAFLKIKTM